MTSQQRKLLALIGVIVEIIALIVVVIGFFVRFSGSGNLVGAVYIYVGGAFIIGGAVFNLWVGRFRWRQK